MTKLIQICDCCHKEVDELITISYSSTHKRMTKTLDICLSCEKLLTSYFDASDMAKLSILGILAEEDKNES